MFHHGSMKSFRLLLLVLASVPGAISLTIEELAAQNELLTATIKRLENKLEHLEQTGMY